MNIGARTMLPTSKSLAKGVTKPKTLLIGCSDSGGGSVRLCPGDGKKYVNRIAGFLSLRVISLEHLITLKKIGENVL